MNTLSIPTFLKASRLFLLLFTLLAVISGCGNKSADTSKSIKGLTILSENKDKALEVIDYAGNNNINHVQLSHKIVHKLKHLKRPQTRKLTNALIDSAHQAGVDEALLWDHALYWLGYYPDKFKTGPDSTLNLDNPELWNWIQDDYRKMLDLAPKADGVVLTFIETGAHVEDQYSEKYPTEEEKLALLVNKLSEVIMDEYNLKLYARTFSYYPSEVDDLMKCLDMIENKDITVMSKSAPNDFFITDIFTYWVKDINYPVIIETDAAQEYNGQGIVASIFPKTLVKRMKYYRSLPNVVGFTSRMDRYKKSSVIGRPTEINYYALRRAFEDTTVALDEIYNDFIAQKYGKQSIPYIKPAFKEATNIITSVYYTLGLMTSHHSQLTYDYVRSYAGYVPERWIDSSTVHVAHDVNKTFHYWKDLANHLGPPKIKSLKGYHGRAILQDKRDRGLIDTTELMNMEYLRYVITEKNYGVRKAEQAFEHIKKAEPHVKDRAAYKDLYHMYKRTLLSARLFRGTAKAYYGYRIYSRGEDFRSEELLDIIKSGLTELKATAKEVKAYPHKGPAASYDWADDARRAMEYHESIAKHFTFN